MIKSYTAGGYVDAWCTKCKLELGHTIIAMVGNVPKRVQCNTCQGEHNYRSNQSGAGSVSSGTAAKVVRKVKAQVKSYDDYLVRLNSADPSKTRKYIFSENFKKDEVIDHPHFGIGVVMSVINSNKIEILFKNGPKLLVQNRA